jgi:hypothetical protein
VKIECDENWGGPEYTFAFAGRNGAEANDAVTQSDAEDKLGILPLEVTLLPPGKWDRYDDSRLKQGPQLHDLVPPRMNSSENDVSELVNLAEQGEPVTS